MSKDVLEYKTPGFVLTVFHTDLTVECLIARIGITGNGYHFAYKARAKIEIECFSVLS